MHIRKFGALAAVAASALALGVAACGDDDGGGSTGGGGGGGDKPYIAIVSKGFQHQFWQAVKKGAEDEAKKQNARITFQGPPTEQDIEQQVTMLTNAMQQNPDAIGFAALDSKASAPLMDQAKA
ncbi:MAG: substrate-binding domain-containing protein, partial [Solirubrobacterales bacterium]